MNTVCLVAGDMLIPPISALQLLKYGSKAIKASPRISAIIASQKRVLQARRLNRIKSLAEDSLKRRNLTQREVAAVESAHNIGRGEIGLDGSPARIGNYTPAQLRQKMKILEEAGFSKAERRKLVEDGVVGLSSSGFARLFRRRPHYLKADGRPRHDQFKDALINGDISGDNQYIAFPYNGQHVAGKITSFNTNRIQVETLDGKRFTVSNESLKEVRISGTSKTYFERKLGRSDRPAYQRFRDDWNVLNISEDNRYISFMHSDGLRRPGIITSIYDDDRKITILDEKGKEIDIRGEALNHIRVSSEAKESLENLGARAPPVNIRSSKQDYNFLSRKVGDYKHNNEVWEVNFNSPHLQQWMREFTDVITKETGIRPTPGIQLSERDKHRIYNIWLRHLVPKVEDPNPGKDIYGDIRSQIIENQGGSGDLGDILHERGAVCLELSMCASVLLSEYGIRSSVITGDIGTGLRLVRNEYGEVVKGANKTRCQYHTCLASNL